MREFKQRERKIFKTLMSKIKNILIKIKNIVLKLTVFLKKEYSLLMVSHSGDKTRSLNINMFMILSIIFLFIISVSSFVFLRSKIEILHLELNQQKTRISIVEEDYAQLNEKVQYLMYVSKRFQSASTDLLQRFGYSNVVYKTGDLDFQSTEDISTFTTYLEKTITPIKEIHQLIELNKDMIDQIPSTWPIKGGIGYISMYFGLNEHPFLGYKYLHSGIDVATGRTGDYIVSTANGTVMETGYEIAYGNFIVIKHGFDFYTRYGHLQRILVKKGQKVERGEKIGILGNTGLSTGPHVHYEIYIGGKHINPWSYMILKN